MKAPSLIRTALACAALAFASSGAFAADSMAGMNMQHMPSMPAAKEKPMASASATQQPVLSNAVIQQIDSATGMITLNHAALDNMGMPAMMMAFKAGEPSMLTQFHVGDKVRVRVEPVNGKATIVTLVKQ